MRNLTQLTNYLGTVEQKYGKESGSIRVILSEQGWTSSGYGEYTQAVAIARAYFIAEFNSRVDAFIIRAEVDDATEMACGLYLGVRHYKSDTKKVSYYVYKYMDTPTVSAPADSGYTALKDYDASKLDFSLEMHRNNFKTAQSILCNTNWKSLVSGYNVDKLNGMPYASPE